MGVTLDDGGLSAALDELGRFAVRTAVQKTVNQMAEDLRTITPRRSGNLVGSLRQEVTDTEGTIGYTVEYAPHVEYGHRAGKSSYVEGQHFLSQEAKAGQVVLERRVGDELRRAGL